MRSGSRAGRKFTVIDESSMFLTGPQPWVDDLAHLKTAVDILVEADKRVRAELPKGSVDLKQLIALKLAHQGWIAQALKSKFEIVEVAMKMRRKYGCDNKQLEEQMKTVLRDIDAVFRPWGYVLNLGDETELF
jgi:hypothetical protein